MGKPQLSSIRPPPSPLADHFEQRLPVRLDRWGGCCSVGTNAAAQYPLSVRAHYQRLPIRFFIDR